MLSPRVEVLCALPDVFALERVVCTLPPGFHLRIERTLDAQAFPVRWELRVNGRIYIDSKVPITFNGIDPFEQFEHQVSASMLPRTVQALDLHNNGFLRGVMP